MLNIGIRAHDLGKQSINSLAEQLSRYDASHIQLALRKSLVEFEEDYGRLSPGAGNFIRDRLYKKGLNISVLGCYINPVHPDPAERERGLFRFCEHLIYSGSFGCSVVGTETGSPLPDCSFTEDIYKEETFSDFLSSLEIMVKTAEKAGSIVGIEGVADKHTIFSHERLSRVFQAIPSPNLRVIYDPVNLLPADRASESNFLMKEAFSLFSSRMAAIHVKDFTIRDGIKTGTLPSGQGSLDYRLLIDLIRFYKPWCPVILENNTPGSMQDSINFIRQMEKGVQK